LFLIYDVGGSVSLLEIGAASGGLRSIKNPTAMGTAIKSTDKHKAPIPIAVAAAGSLLPPTSISAPGTKLANADVAPKRHKHKPGQPHNTTATMVATIPLVFVSIFFSPLVS
jgi:hypothetical protein